MSSPILNQPVFYDPAGRRHRRARGTTLALAALVVALVVILIASLLANPRLPRLDLQPLAERPHAAEPRPLPAPVPASHVRQRARRVEGIPEPARATRPDATEHRSYPASLGTLPRPESLASGDAAHKPLTIGFYSSLGESGYQSLKRNLPQLDWVMPDWVRLQEGDKLLVNDVDWRALELIRQERPATPIIPLVQNSKDGMWNPDILRRMLSYKATRGHLIDALGQVVAQNGFYGIGIDFEEVPDDVQPYLYQFMQELHARFRPRGWIVAQAVPMDDPAWNYRAYAAATDYLLLMAYDQHWAAGQPGSIAAQDWFERTLDRRMRELPPARTIIGLGAYGYDWMEGKAPKDVTFQEAMFTARKAQAPIIFDPRTRNPYFVYREGAHSLHTVWFLDAVTAYNQMRAASRYQPAGLALWRLGAEDPSLWSVFGASSGNAAPAGLHQIRFGHEVNFEGAGEIVQVVAQPQEGARLINIDPATGFINHEDYTVTPSSYIIQCTGDRPGLIALTFDDGPDPVWTPPILDTLKQANVPATFFIIGRNGQAHPNLIRRIVAEGHDIGNHTFTHSHLIQKPERIVNLELNATQRLIESLTGRSTRLFRPPYFDEDRLAMSDAVEPIVTAERLGYITVGLHIDSDDWTRPGVDGIVRRTVVGALRTGAPQRGQVVLLHDGGGDRSQTVAALPRIIAELRAQGFRFVTISELAGLTPEQTMPPLRAKHGILAWVNKITFYSLSLSGRMIYWIFFTGVLFGLVRLVFISIRALVQWRRTRRLSATPVDDTYRPFVTVIVPAYNEERVIDRTIDSLLASTYPCFEVIVVDDGSQDRTSAVLRERYADEPRMRLFTKENEGKAEALNYGLRHARGEVIVALDADTIFAPETIGALARPFADPRIGAVAGNAKVGNRINMITRWQALEYITAQNLDRRAFADMDCITVVPGAVGAWRRAPLEQAGGFTSDTLAEDQDLTLQVHRLGYKVGYEETALAWTEAPDTVRALIKQRFRWSYGTLQCMWKHRDILFRSRYGKLGTVAMPNIWIFQILFPLISPVMDLMLLWALLSAGFDRFEQVTAYHTANLNYILLYYGLFLALDWLAAAFAFALERRERGALICGLFLQRFCYRQVMYYVMIKSVVTAVQGVLVGWGKLERKATVEMPS